VSPGHKRQIAQAFVDQGRCTIRAVCRHFQLHRSTFRYQAKQPDAWLAKLKAALRRLSNAHPELGYPKITRLLKKKGWRVGSRRIQRLCREFGLAAPTKKPKRRRRGVCAGLPTRATDRGHVWTWDFVHDTTVRGGKHRMLNITDEYTRECLCIYVASRTTHMQSSCVMHLIGIRMVSPITAPIKNPFRCLKFFKNVSSYSEAF
jgi:putative transposase